ncbi:MAG: ATP-binding cassette domain-containing protein [Bacteroidota bacterium]
MKTPDSIIAVRNLDFYFKEFKALDQINLNVPTGSIYGFLGPNGAGKTTTIRVLLDLFHAKQGEVEIFGQSIRQHRHDILSRIGALIEAPSIYKHLSGRQNLEVLRRMLGLPKQRIDEVLEIVRLRENADKKAKEYSLGMCQRLTLAAALLNEPELLILDEPTNGLDPSGIIEMRELILRLNQEHGKTIFLSSHILSEIEKLVSHVAIIDRGKILYEGTLAGLQQKSNQNITVAVKNPGQAMPLLSEHNYQLLEQTATGFVVQVNTEEEIAELNRLLVMNDHQVYQLSPAEQGLESIFLNVTQKLDA